MKRVLFVLCAVLLVADAADARQRIAGFCENGGQTVTVAGISSTTTVQRSYASCTVTVYLAGTTTIATIYSDDSGTQKGNPFTAGNDGSWFFYSDTGRYDVRFTAGGIVTPFTRGDWSTGALLNTYSSSTLPVAGTPGALIRRTDTTQGLQLDTGTQWVNLFGDVTNVLDFNARGNGIADDTTAFQNAVNGLPAGGGVVFIPCGSFKITSPIVLLSNTWLRGSGACSIVQVSENVNGFTTTGTQSAPKTFVQFTDFAIQKIVGSIGGNVAIKAVWANDLRIARVAVTNNGGVWGTAFACTDCNRTRIVDAQATGTGSNVIALNQAACGVSPLAACAISYTDGYNNAVIRGVYRNNSQGIDINGQTDFLMDGVFTSGNTSTFAYGFVVEGITLQRGVIRDCVARAHNYGGIDFEPDATIANEVIVSGNSIVANPNGINTQLGGGSFIGNVLELNTTVGIVSTAGQGGLYTGNIFRGNAIGLSLNATAPATVLKNVVVGNYFVNSTTYGIQLAGTQTTNFLAGNIFTNSGTSDYTGLTTGTALIDQNPLNLRGVATIVAGSTSTTVTGIAMPDANYHVVCSRETATGAPAVGSNRCWVSGKTATTFVMNVEADPGVGNSVGIAYLIIR